MADLFFMPYRPAYDGAGISVPGAKAYFTLTGTNTPSAPFTDAGLTVPQTNPVVADAIGKFPPTYLDSAKTYRVRIYSKNAIVAVDTPLEEYDPYVPGALTGTVLSTASTVAGSRAALASLTGPSDSAVLLDGSQWVFDSSNLSTLVTADTAQGIYVAPSSAPTGASGAWVRKFTGAWDARWFGVLFDDESGTGTDNLAAINAMLGLAAALGVGKHSLEKPSVTIEFPGFFFVSDVVNLYTQVHLKGFGIGQSGGQFTRWRVPSGKAALIGNHFLTRGYTATSDGTQTLAAAGSIIEGIKFLGGTANTVGGGAAYDDTAHADGLLMRTQMLVKDCWFEGFQRNGIAILAGSDGNPILGNANNFVIERCTVQYNGSHGLHIQGTDANAGLVTKLDASFNRRWGVLEESFLGTQLIACHAAANGIGNGTTDVDSVTAFPAGGQRYAVAYGQETAAATTTPGTNGAVWVPIDGSTGGRTWASGFVVRSGGPYALRSASISLFGYSEGGQGPDQCISPSISIGGIKGSAGTAFFGDGIRIGATFGSLTLSGGIIPSGSIQIPDDVSANHKFGRFSSGLPFSYFDSSTLSSGFKFRVADGTTDAATITSTGFDLLSGVYRVAGTQVLGARKTGWTADTGTAKRTANATYSGTAEASYTQATIQALMNEVRDLSQTVKALKDDLISLGPIGA